MLSHKLVTIGLIAIKSLEVKDGRSANKFGKSQIREDLNFDLRTFRKWGNLHVLQFAKLICGMTFRIRGFAICVLTKKMCMPTFA